MSHEHVSALIHTHLTRYPTLEIADVYKLLHQATFGPGHAVTNKKIAREWLERDLERKAPRADDPLVENIHPDGALVRLHLRPYVALGGNVKPLLEAFVRSADQVAGDPALMAQRWTGFEQDCRAGQFGADRWNLREMQLFGQAREHEKWPAVRHSPAYAMVYYPSYRVLTRAEAAALCRTLGQPFAPA